MDMLVLGGTRFVGRHLVEAALASGHHVTLFHRGRSGRGLFPAAEEILGDREGSLDDLTGRRFDVAFDTSGYLPRVVRRSAEALRPSVGAYVFVSSVSVYPQLSATREDDPVHEPAPPEVEDILPNYGPLKVGCEHVVDEVFGNDVLVARPGFVVGPHDSIPRLPHLLERFRSPGERLAGRPEQPVQLVDARDLGEWMVRAAAEGTRGTFNLVGPVVSMERLLETVREATGHEGGVAWAPDEFLESHEVAPVDGLAYWVPAAADPLMRVDGRLALSHGLAHRTLEDTVADTLAWLGREAIRLDEAGRYLAGLQVGPDLERELLAELHRSSRL
ncbi:MAG: epimerase [Gemmatimonadota bacterium]|jgi:2'-hydroxyisoflavone reductase